MSYTRPLASAANFSWQGSAAYTRPLASAANASFPTGQTAGGQTASGFTSTTFGSATAQLTQPAAGFSSTLFGTPTFPSNFSGAAAGFSSTLFGTPALLSIFSGVAVGFSNTFLGAPSASVAFTASGFVSTVFGTPTQTILTAVGINSTAFGTATAAQFYPVVSLGPVSIFGNVFFPVNLSLNAQGFSTTSSGFSIVVTSLPLDLSSLCQTFGSSSTQLGTPNAGWLQTGVAAGFSSTAFGTLSVVQTQQASGFTSTQYGTPFTQLSQGAVGFQSTDVGSPYAALTLQAVGVLPKTQFGLSTVSRSNTFTAYGINVANQFGQPRSFNQFNYPASGFISGALGAPTCFRRYLAAPTSPGSCFGKPLLRRNTQC